MTGGDSLTLFGRPFSRLSPRKRGEDEGEGFERVCRECTLIYPSPSETERRPNTRVVARKLPRKQVVAMAGPFHPHKIAAKNF